MKFNKVTEYMTKELPFFFGAASFAWQILFFYMPILFILWLSFSTVGDISHITLVHYKAFFTMVYLRVILQSLVLGLFTAVVCLVIGYPLAYWLVFKTGRLKTIFLFLLLSPFFTNFLLHIYAWFFVLDRGGLLNNILQGLGIIYEPLHFLNTLGATGVMMIYYYLPFMVLPLYSALERFDNRLIEASLDLGASWWQTFQHILLPLTWPGLQIGFLLVYVPACTEFAIPDLMGGSKYMFMGSVVSFFMLGSQTLALGTAFTVISCIIVILSSLCFVSILRRLLL